LGDAIAAALELSLGVETGEIDAVASRQSSGVRLALPKRRCSARETTTFTRSPMPQALYPPLERRAQPGQMRYGAHVDSGMVTVLSIDPANPHGLQVDTSSVGTSGADDERVWVDVPHVKGALI